MRIQTDIDLAFDTLPPLMHVRILSVPEETTSAALIWWD